MKKKRAISRQNLDRIGEIRLHTLMIKEELYKLDELAREAQRAVIAARVKLKHLDKEKRDLLQS